jgi:hypothetical protein
MNNNNHQARTLEAEARLSFATCSLLLPSISDRPYGVRADSNISILISSYVLVSERWTRSDTMPELER